MARLTEPFEKKIDDDVFFRGQKIAHKSKSRCSLVKWKSKFFLSHNERLWKPWRCRTHCKDGRRLTSAHGTVRPEIANAVDGEQIGKPGPPAMEAALNSTGRT